VTRYHPLLVTLHWLLAVLILGALMLGFFALAAMPNDEPQKLTLLRWHMAGGMVILALMIIRFIVRMATSRPPPASTGYPLLDRMAPITHYGFYLLVLLMASSGLATAILAGLNKSVFQGSGDPLPPSFAAYPSFVLHGTAALVLVAFISLHVLAALYHQFIKKDSLLRRMRFGRRMRP
jgi:cytochrome b561